MRRTERPAVMRVAIAVVCAAVATGCGAEPATKAAVSPPRTVHLVNARRGEITRSITLPGVVRPYQEAVLYAKVAGYLKSINVDKGDAVREGTVLATLEMPELSADLARDTAEMEEAQIDYQRTSQAYRKAPDLVVPKTVDEARMRAATTRASVERIKTLLGYATISAPFSGVITRRWADPGAFIPAATGGAPQNAAIVTLTDLARVRVQVPVPEAEVRFIAVGVPAVFAVDGVPGRDFSGSVTRYAHTLDDASKTMLTEIEYANGDLLLRPGMYAHVRLVVERKADALVVPADAVMWEKARASVFTVVEGKAKKLPVRTGFADAGLVEIPDGTQGVDTTTPLVLVGSAPLADGQPVAPEANK